MTMLQAPYVFLTRRRTQFAFRRVGPLRHRAGLKLCIPSLALAKARTISSAELRLRAGLQAGSEHEPPKVLLRSCTNMLSCPCN